ncbi:MAG: hypothetical protein IKJ36_04635 [Clostridia bacterium]|nr:hypothetical protein [Clostridia bacterium]
MKRIMSKILIILILFVMMFEIVFSSNVSHALTITAEQINTITNLAGGLVSIIYWPKRIMIVGLSFVINIVTANMASSTGVNYGDAGILNVITPFDIFFNKYKLLDINFFDIDGAPADSITRTMRLTISGWYYVMRTIAAAILLCILIYVGIRMALTTIAEDKAKYKKMLFDWIVSLALIFVLHYIAVFIIYANNAIVNVLRTLMEGMSKVSDANFGGLPIEDKMTELIIEIGMQGIIGVGIPSMAAVLVFVFIIFQTIAFLIAYLNRMIKIGFLIMISPLISITYSIDKMGDGKAQALGNWLREFIFTILIQPFHCLMYIAFVRTAFTLITSNGNILSIQSFADGIDLLTSPDYNQLVNGVLAILCLKFINDGEKIVRKIFGFQDDNSLTSMAAGMAVGMMAVKNAKKMGATARKGINMAKGGASRIGQAIKSDAAKNIPGISKIANKLDGINDKITNLSDKINDKKTAWKKGFDQSGFGRVYNKATSLPGKFKATKIGGRLASANSLSSTLAVMGAAMAYSTGTTSAGEALGVGSAIGQGTQELFASSTKNISNQNGMSHTSEEQKAYDDLEKSMDTVEDIMNDPDKMSETEAAFSDFEEADKQSAIAKECDAQISKLQADKRDGNADQDVDQQIESLKAKSDAAKLAAEAALLSGRSKDKFGDLEDLYKKLELGPEKDKDGNDMSFAKRLEHAKGDLFDKMKNFNDVGERYSRFSKRATKPKTEEMDAIKNEIIRKLTLLKLNQKSTNDSNVSRELSVDEEDSIERTADRLMQNITGGVLAGRKYSTKDQIGLVKSGLGLDSRADDSSFSALINATSEFETLKQRESISGLHKYHSDYGGDDTALLERELRATPHATGRHTKEIVRQEKDERKNKKSQESGH